jgi:DNA-binding transcriptional LysR family regulator
MSQNHSDLPHRIGRNLKLRDLHTLIAISELGSMAKAANRLGVTQPAISQSVADLEAFVGVRLLDRGPRGVTLTGFGETLLKHARLSFDDLAQGLRDIAFHAGSGVGEVAVASDMSFIAGGMMADIIRQLARDAPGIRVQVIETTTRTRAPNFQELRERQVDLVLGRVSISDADTAFDVETLGDEELLVVAGKTHPLAAMMSLDWQALARANWILASRDNLARTMLAEALAAKGHDLPEPAVTTYSMHLRLQLLQSGSYLTVLPDTAFRHAAERWNLVALPLRFEKRLPVALLSLRNRSPSPQARLFAEAAREARSGEAKN